MKNYYAVNAIIRYDGITRNEIVTDRMTHTASVFVSEKVSSNLAFNDAIIAIIIDAKTRGMRVKAVEIDSIYSIDEDTYKSYTC